jgi:hypothetical protein
VRVRKLNKVVSNGLSIQIAQFCAWQLKFGSFAYTKSFECSNAPTDRIRLGEGGPLEMWGLDLNKYSFILNELGVLP